MVALVLLLSFTSHALNYATLDHQRDAAVLTPLHVPLLRNRFTELAGCFPTCIFTNVSSERVPRSLSTSNNAADWPWCLVPSQGSCSNWSSFSHTAAGSEISALGGDRCMYLLGQGHLRWWSGPDFMIFYYFKLENTCSKKSERCDKPLVEWHKGAAVRL